MSYQVLEGDCVELMAAMPAGSVDSVVCDPPYGLEFMGKEWDRLGGGQNRNGKPGIGERSTGWVSNRGWNAMRCRSCGHLSHGGSPCSCDVPDFGPADNRMQMMQEWHQAWATEALRVLKPGGHLLAFGGTRTYHRLACAVEDAGFEIRDTISWLYGSGFPKSLNVGATIDKAARGGAAGRGRPDERESWALPDAGHGGEARRGRDGSWLRGWAGAVHGGGGRAWRPGVDPGG